MRVFGLHSVFMRFYLVGEFYLMILKLLVLKEGWGEKLTYSHKNHRNSIISRVLPKLGKNWRILQTLTKKFQIVWRIFSKYDGKFLDSFLGYEWKERKVLKKIIKFYEIIKELVKFSKNLQKLAKLDEVYRNFTKFDEV